jgi:hypothetical protein
MITHPDDKLPSLGDEMPEIVGRIQIGGAIRQDQLRLVAGILARSLYKDEWAEGSDWRVSEWRARITDCINEGTAINAVTFYSRTGSDRHCIEALAALGLHVVTSRPVPTRRRTYQAIMPGRHVPAVIDGDIIESGWPLISLFDLSERLRQGGPEALANYVTEQMRCFRAPPLRWNTTE